MNKSELIDAMADSADISKAAAGRALDGMVEAITGALKSGDTVSIVGFGSFVVRERAARTGRNPKTGAAIELSAPAIGNLLKFEPNVSYEVTADGKLVIDSPATFAIRRAVRISGDFQVLGEEADEPDSADEAIEKLYFDAHGQ